MQLHLYEYVMYYMHTLSTFNSTL